MIAKAILLFITAGLLVGCTPSHVSTPGAEGPDGVFIEATPHDVSDVEYIVDPPDEITILSPDIKEIDRYKMVVRPDGKISVDLLGDVMVRGCTPQEISKKLSDLAAKYYMHPDIKAEVVANSKFYYVVGAGVEHPGKRPYTSNDSIIRAIADAGFNDGAWPQQVWLCRPGKNAQAVVDFKKMFETGDLSQNYRLEEGDIIEVRDSPRMKFHQDWDYRKDVDHFIGEIARLCPP
jgi:polysaccharide export outer membrane protein